MQNKGEPGMGGAHERAGPVQVPTAVVSSTKSSGVLLTSRPERERAVVRSIVMHVLP